MLAAKCLPQIPTGKAPRVFNNKPHEQVTNFIAVSVSYAINLSLVCLIKYREYPARTYHLIDDVATEGSVRQATTVKW